MLLNTLFGTLHVNVCCLINVCFIVIYSLFWFSLFFKALRVILNLKTL